MKEGVLVRDPAINSGRFPWSASVLLLLVVAAVLLRLIAPLNHDVAFTLIGAEKLLDGGRFGIDVIDPNPPLSWWIAVVPVALARIGGFDLGSAMSAFTIALVLGSLLLTRAVLAGGSLREGPLQAFLVFTGAVLLLGPGYDFGQREHLMLIGAVPWVAAASLTADGKTISLRLRLVVGIAAGIAFCLKPHFLLAPIAIELWLLWRMRDLRLLLRPEACALAAVGISYFLALLLAAPAYLTKVVPDAAAVYWAFDSSSRFVLARFASALLPTLAAGILISRSARMSPLAKTLVVASAGAFAGALLQHKGWDYHWVPGVGLAGLAAAALYLGSARRSRPRGLLVAAGLLVFWGNFGNALDAGASSLAGNRTSARVQSLAAAIRTEGRSGASVFAFSTSPRDVHPAVIASGARWSAAACCLQWLPAEVRAGELPTDERRRAEEVGRRSRGALIDHLERSRPDIILVDNDPKKLGFADRPFDYLPYFMMSGRFRAFWSDYEERASVAEYRVFVRKR